MGIFKKRVTSQAILSVIDKLRDVKIRQKVGRYLFSEKECAMQVGLICFKLTLYHILDHGKINTVTMVRKHGALLVAICERGSVIFVLPDDPENTTGIVSEGHWCLATIA